MGRDVGPLRLGWQSIVSIHAPRVGRDPGSAGTAGAYAHSYLKQVGFSPEIAEYADIASLNPYVVAEYASPDLDGEGQAGIARTVNYLVAHARKSIDAPVAA